MNFFRKGPDLKLPKLKVPDFLVDVYFDLKERHLLPLAAILLVAIFVAPIALNQSSETEGTIGGAGAEAGVAATSAAARRTDQLVAKSAPGLREYRRRLDNLQAKDPFKQQYAEAEESASSEAGAGAESDSSIPSEGTPIPTPPSEPGAQPTPGPGELTYYSYAIDVRVSTGGSQESVAGTSPKSTVRRNLPELTMLPNRATPAVVYMGSTRDGKKAVMLVSSNVDAIFGDAKCVLGSQTCELLVMEPGLPETFVYGGAGRTFGIEIKKIHLVATDKLNRAPLGKPPKQGKGN